MILSYPKEEGVYINHLPVIFAEDNVLIGHMSRKNPQWMNFSENKKSMIIISGPHTYITPSWYRSGRDVPTWNYAAIHLHGEMKLVEGLRDQIKILASMTKYFESQEKKPWSFSLPDDLKGEKELTEAIVSFRFRIKKTEAKLKFSQNRSQDDKDGIIAGLATRPDEMSRLVRDLML